MSDPGHAGTFLTPIAIEKQPAVIFDATIRDLLCPYTSYPRTYVYAKIYSAAAIACRQTTTVANIILSEKW